MDEKENKIFSSIDDLITKSRNYIRTLINKHLEKHVHDANQQSIEVKIILDNLKFIRKKWVIEILWVFEINGGMIFNDLMRKLNKISSSLLSDRLKALLGHKLIERKVQDTSPISVFYELSDKGKGFIELSMLLFFYMSGLKI